MNDILQLMVQLEDDVAEFYKKLTGYKSLATHADLFKYMSEHSAQHSQTIQHSMQSFSPIPLNRQKFIMFQSRMMQELTQQISNITDEAKLSEMLGEAEGLMGMAYDKIADNFEQNGKLMLNFAATIRDIAAEERQHKKDVMEIGKQIKK